MSRFFCYKLLKAEIPKHMRKKQVVWLQEALQICQGEKIKRSCWDISFLVLCARWILKSPSSSPTPCLLEIQRVGFKAALAVVCIGGACVAVAGSGKGELPFPCLHGCHGDFVPKDPRVCKSTAALRRCNLSHRGYALAGVGAVNAGKGLCTGRMGTRSFCACCLPGTKATADCAASAKEKHVENSQGKKGKLGGRWAQLESKHIKCLSDYLHTGKKDFLLSF